MQQTLKGAPLIKILPDFIREVDISHEELLNRKDLNNILTTLPHVKLRKGYSLGAYRFGDWMGWLVEMYPFRTGSTDEYDPEGLNMKMENKSLKSRLLHFFKVKRDDEENKQNIEQISKPVPFRDGQIIPYSLLLNRIGTIPKLKDYLEIDFTPESVWESLLLLELSSNYLPHGWHGGYANGSIIANEQDLIDECEGMRNLKETAWRPFLTDERLIPSVTMAGAFEASINVCRWNDWRGLDQLTFHAYREGHTIRFECDEPVNLIKYDCGVCF